MTLTQRLSLLWRRFSPLEEQLFGTIRSVVPDDARAVFDAQVDAVNHVQRLPGWVEIDYYRRRSGRVDWSGVRMFPRTAEFQLARVEFSVGGRYRATLSCIAGHIFDFSIAPAPRAIAFEAWDAAGTARLLGDPRHAGLEGPALSLLDRWTRALDAIRSDVGSDWILHDSRTAYRVTLEEGEFVVLAERCGDEFVLHRLEPPADILFHVPSHDDRPRPLQRDVADVLRRSNG